MPVYLEVICQNVLLEAGTVERPAPSQLGSVWLSLQPQLLAAV